MNERKQNTRCASVHETMQNLNRFKSLLLRDSQRERESERASSASACEWERNGASIVLLGRSCEGALLVWKRVLCDAINVYVWWRAQLMNVRRSSCVHGMPPTATHRPYCTYILWRAQSRRNLRKYAEQFNRLSGHCYQYISLDVSEYDAQAFECRLSSMARIYTMLPFDMEKRFGHRSTSIADDVEIAITYFWMCGSHTAAIDFLFPLLFVSLLACWWWNFTFCLNEWVIYVVSCVDDCRQCGVFLNICMEQYRE